MILYLVVFAVCLVVVGGSVALMMSLSTPRYRTEPQHLLQLFERVLNHQATEAEWNALVGYPIRHDEYLEGVRRSAQELMEMYGRPWRAAQGGCLLSPRGREGLIALRDHLASRLTVQEGKQAF
ncbi:hypothetical protein SAMN02745148_00014 [Modicisalibacter ilicicola DSM 19980]|uniref:Uncharacterized protein n=1 Tax=Modicisalibacter ilicicola DSM 19980 TaxID=1121942 RepID=A0A1M4S949_9GAMM|nr:hypothetical protein [Halomonas ilicicola]SHE28557.1 hypothetical protein SAMN02745148_00014 [Halomonas ilicicola DSM 19980]